MSENIDCSILPNVIKDTIMEYILLYPKNMYDLFSIIDYAVCVNLKYMKTNGSDDYIMQIISLSHKLKYIKLRYNSDITEYGLQLIQHLPLIYFNLCNDYSKITNNSLRYFQNMPLLHLGMSISFDNKLTDEGIKYLGNITTLRHLSLHGSSITEQGLKYIQHMQLDTLHLSWCHNLSNDGLQYLQNMPLKELYLTESHKITDGGLWYLRNNTTITKINIYGCNKITDVGLQYLYHMPLTDIWFTWWMDGISDDGINKLRTHIPNINLQH